MTRAAANAATLPLALDYDGAAPHPAAATHLAPVAADTVRTPAAEAKPRTLWCCVHLPALALQAAGLDWANPGAVFEMAGERALVYQASPVAAGVYPGLPLAQARALCEGLDAKPRRPQAEQDLLQRLAQRLDRFTPVISLVPPCALLLDVQASLALFGGAAALRQSLAEELAARHCPANVAAAPTPLAAQWLAAGGRSEVVTERAALRSALGRLPLSLLPLDAKLQQRLAAIGARKLRDLWRLPRAGLARRFGPGLVRRLDAALGEAPDPRIALAPAERFYAQRELPWEVVGTGLLLPVIEQLLARLGAFLRARDAGVVRIQLALFHSGAPATRLEVGLRLAGRDPDHFLQLAALHLEAITLPAPVIALELTSGPLQRFTAATAELLPLRDNDAPERRPQAQEAKWHQLLEQLQARLGAGAIQPLATHADHRPERAWAPTAPSRQPGANAERPLWLLPEPRPIAARSLHCLRGPERIESGWWDGYDTRRDYHHAADADGRRLWVFRDLVTRRWFVHGLFG